MKKPTKKQRREYCTEALRALVILEICGCRDCKDIVKGKYK